MMKKENFVKMIECLHAQDRKNHKFEQALEPFFDNYLMSIMTSKIQNDIIDLLEDEMGDKFETVSWWLYDAPEAGKSKENCFVEVKGVKIPVETSEQLYDFLKDANG